MTEKVKYMKQQLWKLWNLSNDKKVKIVQALVYIITFFTLVFAFDLKLFLISLVVGWFTFAVAGSMCLHKLAAHRSWTPKNRLIKWIVICWGTLGGLGSTIAWAAGHREHHRHTDLKTDPHRPYGSLWHKFKMWFYYFPVWNISPGIVKDLMSDPDHKFFHRHYFKIILTYIAILGIIDIRYIGYFWAIPVLYLLFGISWATVIAHIRQLGYFSWRTFNTKDYTYNSNFWQVIVAGEGYHNTHHACPWLWDTAIYKGEFDITAWFIKLVGKGNNNPGPVGHAKPRTGKALRKELDAVYETLVKEGHEKC